MHLVPAVFIRRKPLLGRACAGFSLVETTIAVGIAALGIISLLGLLPQGLDMSRKTSNMAAEARIVQDVINELQSSDWNNVDGYAGIRIYDDQGVRLSGTGTDMQIISYVAKVELPATGSTMPGAPAATPDPYLKRVIIKTTSSTSMSFDFTDTNRNHYATHSFLLSKTH